MNSPQCPKKLFFQEPCTLAAVNVSHYIALKGSFKPLDLQYEQLNIDFSDTELVFNCQTDYRKTKRWQQNYCKIYSVNRFVSI